MPIPFILGGVALAAGAFGAKKAYDGHCDKKEAENINSKAQDIFDDAKSKLEKSRDQANKALENLGLAKIHIHEHSFSEFIDIYSQIKNIEESDFSQDDLSFDIKEFIAFTKESVISFAELAGGGIASLGAGALAGIGAYGSVGLLASASTGTAISTLGGAAATNATLAWLGGGSLAAGGFGMAGGMAVLGGIVAAPVLALGGFLYSKAGEKALDDARSNLAKANVAKEEMDTARIATNSISTIVNEAIREIEKLDVLLVKDLAKFRAMVEGNNDYSTYSNGEKSFMKYIVNLVKVMSGICKVNVLREDGKIASEFKAAILSSQEFAASIMNK